MKAFLVRMYYGSNIIEYTYSAVKNPKILISNVYETGRRGLGD